GPAFARTSTCHFTIRPPSPEKDGRPLRRFFISTRSVEIIRQAFSGQLEASAGAGFRQGEGDW
ncbi:MULTISPECIES: hypothetical protein, partial [Rhizobium]|uniref:hypothetical protein n=1 Tax=Rhizobium TaxID=379 RepID=UPI001C82860F